MPLLWVFLALCVGIAFGSFFQNQSNEKITLLFLFAFFLFASIAISIAILKKTAISNIFLLLSILAFGGFRFSISSHPQQNDISKLAGREATVMGRIIGDVERKGDRQKFDIEAFSANASNKTFPVSGKMRIYYYRGKPLDSGGKILAFGKITEPRPNRNPFGIDFKRVLARDGIRATLSIYERDCISVIDSTGGGSFIARVVGGIRKSARSSIDFNMHGAPSALLKGLLLGDRRELPKKVLSAFCDTGTIHVLAVSGLHVGIIAGIVWLILGVILRLRKELAVAITILVLILYSLVVGGNPPVVRASVMFSIVLLGKLFKKPTNLANSIGTAGCLLLIVNPSWVFEVGFQLSFSATLGIAILMPVFENWVPPKALRAKFFGNWIVKPFIVSLSATFGTLPFIAHHFHRVQIISPLANLVVVPPLSLILGWALAGTIFGAIPLFPFLFLSKIFFYASWVFLKFMLFAVDSFSRLSFAYLPFPHFDFWWILLYFAVIAISIKILKNRWSLPIFISIIAILITIGYFLANHAFRDEKRITFFDVGQGDCALIEFGDGREMLIDGGPPGNASFCVAPYLRAMGLRSIDAVVLSHPDADHLGGIAELMDDFRFDMLLIPFNTATTEGYRSFLGRAESLKIDIILANPSLKLDKFPEIEFLSPDTFLVSSDGSLKVKLNEASIVKMLSFGDAKILFTGDIGIPTEAHLVENRPDLECDVIKVPHHGSKNSSSLKLIESSTPMLAVISAGQGNRFGHPTQKALDNYRKFGSDIARTDIQGAIIITFRSDSIICKPFTGERKAYPTKGRPTPMEMK